MGDENAPRPWSRHSLKKAENSGKSSNGVLNKKGKKEEEVDDPMREEFLDVMLRGKSKIWSNDTSVAPSVKVDKKGKVLVKKADEPVGAESKDAKRSSDTEKSKKRNVVAPTDDVDDLEYFKSRVKKNLSDSDSDSESGSDEDKADDDDGEADGHDGDIRIFPDDDEAGGVENDGDDDAMKVEEEDDGKTAQDSKADSDDVLQTGRLFVRNLPYTATYWIVLFIFQCSVYPSVIHLLNL